MFVSFSSSRLQMCDWVSGQWQGMSVQEGIDVVRRGDIVDQTGPPSIREPAIVPSVKVSMV